MNYEKRPALIHLRNGTDISFFLIQIGVLIKTLQINDTANWLVDYIHDFTSFNGDLGNFYSGVGHQDTDGDGVADQMVVLPGNQQADAFALTQTQEAYQLQ